MTALEESLLNAIREGDEVAVAAYQDWLLDNGRAVDAAAMMDTAGAEIKGIECLLGKMCRSVAQVGSDELVFTLVDGQTLTLFHEQDCCESVYIESVDGDLNDLVMSPLTQAEESSNQENTEYGSNTWTFYKFATVKGFVTVRWCGSSNGYYSESVHTKVNGERVY